MTATPPRADDTRYICCTAEAAQVEAQSSVPGNQHGDRRREGTLLSADDADAVEIVNPTGAGTAVLVCDHASNRIPQRLGTLGLGAFALGDHIAWDPGAADVARRLSSLLDAPLVSSGYSRLVIDCNRPLDSPESIPACTGGVQVPGNRKLPDRERAQRTDALFRPYHRAITELLDRRSGRASVLLSIHSFAPVFAGRPRPWSIGLAAGRDRRLAELLLEEMKRDPGLVVGDNEPYDVDDAIDYTIPVHGEGRGLPHVLIEIRQDTLEAPEQAARWAARLAKAFRAVEPAAVGFCATTGA